MKSKILSSLLVGVGVGVGFSISNIAMQIIVPILWIMVFGGSL